MVTEKKSPKPVMNIATGDLDLSLASRPPPMEMERAVATCDSRVAALSLKSPTEMNMEIVVTSVGAGVASLSLKPATVMDVKVAMVMENSEFGKTHDSTEEMKKAIVNVGMKSLKPMEEVATIDVRVASTSLSLSTIETEMAIANVDFRDALMSLKSKTEMNMEMGVTSARVDKELDSR